MFRSLVLSAGVLAGAALLTPAARAADEPKDLLAQAIKAHGGEAVLTKYKAARMKVKGKIDVPGVGEVECTQETAYMVPDKFREAMELKVGGQTVTILVLASGDKFTIEANGTAVAEDDKVKDALKEVGHMLEVGRLVPLKDKKYELNIIGEDKVEGKKVVGVRVSMKNRKDMSLYFDKETHLITKLEYRTVDVSSGNEVSEERIITEYAKNKDGVPVPKAIIVKRDGKKLYEGEVTEHTMLEKIDDGEFKK
jgi:hypothetical protein